MSPGVQASSLHVHWLLLRDTISHCRSARSSPGIRWTVDGRSRDMPPIQLPGKAPLLLQHLLSSRHSCIALFMPSALDSHSLGVPDICTRLQGRANEHCSRGKSRASAMAVRSHWPFAQRLLCHTAGHVAASFMATFCSPMKVSEFVAMLVCRTQSVRCLASPCLHVHTPLRST